MEEARGAPRGGGEGAVPPAPRLRDRAARRARRAAERRQGLRRQVPVVITDRRVLDRQLQTTMRQFEQTLGVVENIDTTSRPLKEALEPGKTIIVTTLQKFPVIAKEIGELPGQRFAVIVDEAHSFQSGESTRSLKAVLAAGSLEAASRGRSRTAARPTPSRT
ncbi:MAG: DEAD/DEAH box helicase family protein [Planctomycetota bacterium]